MSKQSDAKEAQGYVTSAPTCSNCKNLTSDMVLPKWMIEENAKVQAKIDAGTNRSWDTLYGDDRLIEKNVRCGIGGFAVKKMGSCSKIAI